MMKKNLRNKIMAGIISAALLTGSLVFTLPAGAAEDDLSDSAAVVEAVGPEEGYPEDSMVSEEEGFEYGFADEGFFSDLIVDDEFAEDEEDASEETAFLAASETWSITDGVLTVSGTGEMSSYNAASDAPWYAESANVVSIVIDGLTSVSKNAFAECTGLKKVTLPSDVTAVEDGAFPDVSLVICGDFGSFAEDYAADKGLRFEPASVTDISGGEATLSGTSFAYTGSAITPAVTVKYSKTTLVKDTDYTVSYSANTNAGTATATVKGTGLYSGTLTANFTITAVSISSATVSGIAAKTYNGSAQTQNLTVTLGGRTLAAGTDYTAAYQNNVNVGTATVVLTGKGNYTGTLSKTFTISAASLAGASVSGITDQDYRGADGCTQNPTVVVAGKTLKNGTDYTLSYQNNVKAGGTATVTITGKGNYNGSVSKQFKIRKTSIKKATVTNIVKKVYNGKKQKQNPVVVVNGRTLVMGTDYKVTYKNNVKIGTATMTIKGKGGYTGRIKKKFKIRKASMSDCTVSGITDKTFTGKNVTQTPTVKLGSKKLKAGKDYKATYKNNLNVGTATITIKGKGNFKGKYQTTFRITKANLKNAKVTDVKDQAYTGQAVTQKPTVKLNGNTLKEGRDYTISYQNNVRIGTATMIITGKGNCTGELRTTFKIRILSLSNAKVSDIDDMTMTGSPLNPKVTVKVDNKTLKQGTDYTLSYSNNTIVGRATVTITGRGGYEGTIKKTFMVLPYPTYITEGKLLNGRLSLKWKEQSELTKGYQIQYDTDKDLSNGGKTLKQEGARTTSNRFVVSGDGPLYVRIRTYSVVDGQTIYSRWSNIYTVQ